MTKRGKRVLHDKERKEGATGQIEERGRYMTNTINWYIYKNNRLCIITAQLSK